MLVLIMIFSAFMSFAGSVDVSAAEMDETGVAYLEESETSSEADSSAQEETDSLIIGTEDENTEDSSTDVIGTENENTEDPGVNVTGTQTESVTTQTDTANDVEDVQSMQITASAYSAGNVDETGEDDEELIEEDRIGVNALNDAVNPQELYQYVDSLVIKIDKEGDGSYVEVTDDTDIYHGDDLEIEFTWTIDGDTYKDYKTYYYQLPVTLNIDAAVTGDVKQDGTVVGKYVVDTDGKVTITYNDNYNANNNTIVNEMSIKGTAKYVPDATEDEMELLYRDENETLVVLNTGDFSVKKTAVRTFNDKAGTGAVSHSSTIKYTVKISSELGTKGEFTIKDTIQKSNFKDGDEISLDPTKIVLKDQSGKTISINPTVTTSSDGKTLNVTIENVPALSANGSYTLTYYLDVEQTGNLINSREGSAESEVVKNKVTVKNDDYTHSASADVTYTQVLDKRYIKYDSSNNRIQWQTYIFPNRTNIGGYVFTDTASEKLVGTVTLQAYNYDGVQMLWYQEKIDDPKDLIVSADGKTFSFSIPNITDGDQVRYWYVTYYTEASVKLGETLSTTNTSTIVTPGKDETWSETVKKDTVGVGVTAPAKTGLGYGDKDENGIVPFNWKVSVDYQDVVKDTYEISDQISVSQVLSYATSAETGNSYTYWDWNAYPYDHYGVVGEIDEAIKKSLVVTTTDGDKLSYEQLLAQGASVKIIYYAGRSDTTTKVTDSDATTYYFKVQISGVTPTNIAFTYNTNYDTQHYSAGRRWRMLNVVTADTTSVEKTQEYTEPVDADGGINKQAYLNGTHWVSGSYTYDYDDLDGELTFRLLATLPKGSTTLTVKDVLPEGFSYQEDSIRIGSYNADKDDIGEEWDIDSSKINISEPDEDGDNTLIVEISDIGSTFTLKDNNLVVIEYSVDIEYDFQQMEGAEVKGKTDIYGNPSGFTGSYTFTNTATNVNPNGEDKSSSFDTTVTRDLDVMDKAGKQVKTESGATTSTVHYTIDINKDRLDLMENSDELTLEDLIYSSELTFELDRTSIHLYEVDEKTGAKTDVDLSGIVINSPNELPDDVLDNTGSIPDGTYCQYFKMKIKDETYYVLEYDYNVLGAITGTSGTLINIAGLSGMVYTMSEDDAKNIIVRASTNNASLRVYKVDSENSAKTLNAKFKLQRYNSTTNSFVDVSGTDGFDITESGKLYDYFATGQLMKGNTLYRLVEIEAPEGYQLPDNPYTYFIIKGNVGTATKVTDLVLSTEEEAKKAAYGSRTTLGTGDNAVKVSDIEDSIHMLEANTTSTIEIKNEPLPDLNVRKVDTESDDPLAGADFELWKVDETATVTIPNTSLNGTKVAEGTTDESGNLTFETLEDGIYYLYESKAPDGYNLLAYSIKVQVKKGVIAAVTDNTNEYTIKGSGTYQHAVVNSSKKEVASFTFCINPRLKSPDNTGKYTLVEDATYEQIKSVVTATDLNGGSELTADQYQKIKRIMYWYMEHANEYVDKSYTIEGTTRKTTISNVHDATQRVIWSVIQNTTPVATTASDPAGIIALLYGDGKTGLLFSNQYDEYIDSNLSFNLFLTPDGVYQNMLSVSKMTTEVKVIKMNDSITISVGNSKGTDLPPTGGMSLKVQKVWSDDTNANRPGSVRFYLKRKNAAGVVDESFTPIEIEVSEESGWMNTIGLNLTEADLNYVYYLEEDGETADGLVTIGANVYQVTYDENNQILTASDTNLEFKATNKLTQNIQVPQTGASSRWFMLFGGLGAVILAAVYFTLKQSRKLSVI